MSRPPLSSSSDEIARLVNGAAAAIKGDPRGATAMLDRAFALARESGNDTDAAIVAEELSRAWSRRRSPARSLHHASIATRLVPARRAAWTTLAKACELAAARTGAPSKQRRARALYRASAAAFKKAAGLTKDPEDRRWLLELAGDAARQGRTPPP
jgi:hypothetical protein